MKTFTIYKVYKTGDLLEQSTVSAKSRIEALELFADQSGYNSKIYFKGNTPTIAGGIITIHFIAKLNRSL